MSDFVGDHAEQVDAAAARIRGHVRRTPTLTSDLDPALRFKPEGRGEEGGDGDEDMQSTRRNRAASVVPQPMDLDSTTLEQLDPDTQTARRLTKTLLDQQHLSPFPVHTRPLHCDYGSALQLYPLPTALVIADADAPAFALNYMGCCVMNPGKIVEVQQLVRTVAEGSARARPFAARAASR